MRYIGIDPGLTGALAAIDCDGLLLDLDDMPVLVDGTRKKVDAQRLQAWVSSVVMSAWRHHVDLKFVVEVQNPRPVQGVVSAFRMGAGYGTLEAVLDIAKVPWVTVTPTKWKKSMKVTKDKLSSLTEARRRWPKADLSRKKDHGRAEALLIAEYARLNSL